MSISRKLSTFDTLDIFCSNRSCHKLIGVLATDSGNCKHIVDMSDQYLKTGRVFVLCDDCVRRHEDTWTYGDGK